MKSPSCSLCVMVVCMLVSELSCSPVASLDETSLEAASASAAGTAPQVFLEQVGDVDEGRAKREVGLKVAAGFGVTNFLLDFIFGKVNQVIDYKTKLVTQFDRSNRYKNYYLLDLGTNPVKNGGGAAAQGGNGGGVGGGVGGGGSGGVATTTEDIPVFESNRVSLDLPPQLFGSGFSLVTSISKIVGDVILNTASRTQRFVASLEPIFGNVLNIETSNDADNNSIEESRRKRHVVSSDVARIAEQMEERHMRRLRAKTLTQS